MFQVAIGGSPAKKRLACKLKPMVIMAFYTCTFESTAPIFIDKHNSGALDSRSYFVGRKLPPTFGCRT